MSDRPRILLVDDEKDLVELVKLRLESSGYEVLVAYDGMAGLSLARKENPDLIILDLMLPKMDGYRVCAMLKFDSKFKDTPIILFTARAGERDKDMGCEAKADSYILKPFDPKVLLSKIEELLKKSNEDTSYGGRSAT